jgi:hypothetical protein
MFIARAAVAAAAIAAPLAFAAPAMAQPMDFQCAPCVADINGDNKIDPIWNEVTSLGPWEPFFDATNGNPTDGKGAWESGVEAVNGGAWEKVFPPPPD